MYLAEPAASFPPRGPAPTPGMQERLRLRLELDGSAPRCAASASSDALHREEASGRAVDAPARRARGPAARAAMDCGSNAGGGARPRTRRPARRRPAIFRGRDRRARTRTGRRARRRERGCSGRRRGASRAASSAARNAPATADWRRGSARPAQSSPTSRSRDGRPGSARLRLTIGVEAQVPDHVLGTPAQRLLAGQAAALARRLRERGAEGARRSRGCDPPPPPGRPPG